MHLSSLTIENFRCIGTGADRLVVEFQKGLTALVGANDAGKTAIIDALRFALGTSDQERMRIEDTDFNSRSGEIKILCKFEGLSIEDQATFAEFLTYAADPAVKPSLHVNWLVENSGQARAGRPYYRVETRSGANGDGPHIPQEIRILLNATYLRPLRDAQESLSAGRYSRLSQVLKQSSLFASGDDECDMNAALDGQNLSLVGIARLFRHLLSGQRGVLETRTKIDKTLDLVTLVGETLASKISVSGADASDEASLKELLEKLDLSLSDLGRMGLGSDNILFMACELLLLESSTVGNRMLLIEEPEAHLHAQRQLQLVRSLQTKAEEEGIQIILTTHSPNLASVIDLDNLVIIKNRKAYPLAQGWTKLEGTDRGFLQRFLDVTKSNLFFACGVMIVEGDAENILVPTLARLIGRDFTSHGVSIVNVGGVGLGRYSRIFQRSDTADRGELGLAVSCVTDMDVMPDCAPVILGLIEENDPWPPTSNRRKWRAKRDIGDTAALDAKRSSKCAGLDGQGVKAFVADEWTLEYNIAYGNTGDSSPLAEWVWMAISLADDDDKICSGRLTLAASEVAAKASFAELKEGLVVPAGATEKEVLASKIYARFKLDKISKPIAAQYLALLISNEVKGGRMTAQQLRDWLPKYLVDAIDHVTGGPSPDSLPESGQATA